MSVHGNKLTRKARQYSEKNLPLELNSARNAPSKNSSRAALRVFAFFGAASGADMLLEPVKADGRAKQRPASAFFNSSLLILSGYLLRSWVEEERDWTG